MSAARSVDARRELTAEKPELTYRLVDHPQRAFNGATFSGAAEFKRATFSGDAGFSRVTFTRAAPFDGATFASGESSLPRPDSSSFKAT